MALGGGDVYDGLSVVGLVRLTGAMVYRLTAPRIELSVRECNWVFTRSDRRTGLTDSRT